MKTKPKIGARERILNAALELFNADGTSSVSTNHIAEAAGISVGNLYYHFKNKEDIVLALFLQYGGEFGERLSVSEGPLTLETMNSLLRINQEILWNYRFLLREIGALFNRDKRLADAYLELRERGMACIAGLLHAFADAGVIRPITDPDTFTLISKSIIFIGEFYLPFLDAGNESIGDSHMEESTRLMHLILKPYILEGNP